MKNNKKLSVKKVAAAKSKGNISFDEDSRRDYLLGFHKRKIQRRRDAKTKIQDEIKHERKKIRNTSNALFNTKQVVEVEDLEPDSETFDLKQHTVTVTEIGDFGLASQGNTRIGIKKVEYEESENDNSDNEESAQEGEVPGMDLEQSDSDASEDSSCQQKPTPGVKGKQQGTDRLAQLEKKLAHIIKKARKERKKKRKKRRKKKSNGAF